MVLNDLFHSIPDTRILTFNQLFSSLRIGRNLLIDQFIDDERLIEIDCHFLRQTALPHLQTRADCDNGTA